MTIWPTPLPPYDGMSKPLPKRHMIFERSPIVIFAAKLMFWCNCNVSGNKKILLLLPTAAYKCKAKNWIFELQNIYSSAETLILVAKYLF